MARKKEGCLRIAMYGQRHVPSCEGGIEVVVENLAARMVERGHSVTCYNRGNRNLVGPSWNNRGQSIYRGIHMKKVLTLNMRGWAALSSACSAAICTAFGPYDIVHIHAEGPAIMCWLPKMMGKKVFVTVHGLDHQREKWGRMASACILRGEINAVRYADEIIVLSEGVQEYFKETYGRETNFIPNGAAPVRKRTAEYITEQWNLHENDYILFMGRLVPEKGLRYLVEAFKKVKTDKKLVIAGGYTDSRKFYEELKRMARSDERIIFTDFVEGKIKRELYSNAYVYTLPSDLEGMPLTLVEAMSYGNCCLTSDIRECTDVYEGCGISFRKGNTDDLAMKLQELCDRPELVQAYKERAEEFILNKYSWEDVVDQTLALYKR